MERGRLEPTPGRILEQPISGTVRRIARLENRTMKPLPIGGEQAPGLRFSSRCAIRTACDARDVQSSAGAPAIIPSKSAGKRCASFIP